MKFTRWIPAAAVMGLLCLPAFALAVTIDATALTPPTFRVLTVTGPLSTAAAQTLELDPGEYVFSDEANGIFSFVVDAGGLVTYNPTFENFLDGAGTTTLTVRGFDLTFDATALTSPTFRVDHVFYGASTSVIRSATMLPSDYNALGDAASNDILFHVDYNGNFQVVSGSEDYMFGAGTPNLVIRGFDFTVDARALSSPRFQILNIVPVVSTGTVRSVTGIPGGNYEFYDVLGHSFLFAIDPDGAVRYNAAYESFLDGAGSAGLVVAGFGITVEPCGLVPQVSTFIVRGMMIDPASTATPQSFVGIPGQFYLLAAGIEEFGFGIDGAGLLTGLPTTFRGIPVTGTGTTTLGIGSCVTTGSVAGSVVADCPAAGTPLPGVHVDAFEVGSGSLAGGAVTDAGGNYSIGNLSSGPYTVTVVTPLGYTAAPAEVSVTVSGGQTATASYALHCVAIVAHPRSIGFWKHQIGVATGGNGQADVNGATLCSYLDLIASHFNSNAINQVVVYVPPASGACSDKLQVARALINLVGSVEMKARAKQQLTSLLLNVAAGYISQTQVISPNGATVSQAITYCDNLIDSPTGDYERAKTIADLINNGQQVSTGMVPVGTPVIAYSLRRPRDEVPALRLDGIRPSPAQGAFTVAFSLTGETPAWLEVVDVAGRRVLREELGRLRSGPHSLRLGEGASLPAGVYTVRLREAGRTVSRSLVVVR